MRSIFLVAAHICCRLGTVFMVIKREIEVAISCVNCLLDFFSIVTVIVGTMTVAEAAVRALIHFSPQPDRSRPEPLVSAKGTGTGYPESNGNGSTS